MPLSPSQQPYTLNRFFQHMREAVMYFPASGNYDVQTFAWIDSQSDLISENLEHDIRSNQSDYCYSKRYDKKKSSTFEIAAPLLLVQEIGGTFTNLFKGENRPQGFQHRILVYLLDRWENNKDQANTKADRELAEVYKDTRHILRQVMQYFLNVKYCTITKLDASTVSGYYNTKLLEYQDNNNLITSWETKETKLNESVKDALGSLQNLPYEIVFPVSGSNYVGTRIEMTFTEAICEAVNFDFSQAGNSFVYGKD